MAGRHKDKPAFPGRNMINILGGIFVVGIIALLIRQVVLQSRAIYDLKDKLENQTGKTDLELATVAQILDQLVKRPNYRFMFIVPHLSKEGSDQALNVEIHSSNVPVRMALDVLKATYEGVLQNIRRDDPDEDVDDLDEEIE
jgi:hypothetical protein